jgi:hypothetical protein
MSVYLWASGTVPVAWPDPDADGYTTEPIIVAGMRRAVDGRLHVDYPSGMRHRWTLRWSAIAGSITADVSWVGTYGAVFDAVGPVSFVGKGYHGEGTYTVHVTDARYYKVSPGAWGAEMTLEEY